MKFEQPKEFLDLCKRLQTTEPDFELAKKILDPQNWGDLDALQKLAGLEIRPYYRLISHNFRQSHDRAFEFLVQLTTARLAKDYGAQPLQKADEHLLVPYTFDNMNGCYYLVLDRNRVAELDFVLRFGKDQIWVFEAKARRKTSPNQNHIRVFTDIAQNGTKIAYAKIRPEDGYDARFKKHGLSALKKTSEYNIVATYLPITHEQLEDFTEELRQTRLERWAYWY